MKPANHTPAPAAARDADRVRKGLERAARRRGDMPAPQVLVQAPGFEFTFGDQEKPYHAASIGKSMTAALVTMLVEEDRFDFTTPIGELLPAADLTGLPAVPGVDTTTDVTVEHLLTHTSGLPDFFEPPHGGETACSIRTLATNRDRLWLPSALLDEARRLRAVGRPGELFHYTDTGYLLLGRIAEEALGDRFAALLRERVLEPSGMTRSSMPYDPREAPDDLAELDIAPFWINGAEFSRARSLSLAYGGGNIVTVPGDLVRFQRALHGGQLISKGGLEHLTRPRRRFRRGIRYGAGYMTLRFGEFAPPLMRGLPQPVGGLGFFATQMFHYPEQDAHVVLNFHSNREMNRSFMTHLNIVRLLSKLDRA